MKIAKFHIYLADLNPAKGTEPGKIRPVVVVQTDLLNASHFSTIICPITSKVIKEAEPLRLYISRKDSGLDHDSDVLIDQIRAIDNRRLMKEIGRIPRVQEKKLIDQLRLLIME